LQYDDGKTIGRSALAGKMRILQKATKETKNQLEKRSKASSSVMDSMSCKGQAIA
jgi:hypothetical protein